VRCLPKMRKDTGDGGPSAVLALLGLWAVQLHAPSKKCAAAGKTGFSRCTGLSGRERGGLRAVQLHNRNEIGVLLPGLRPLPNRFQRGPDCRQRKQQRERRIQQRHGAITGIPSGYSFIFGVDDKDNPANLRRRH